MSFIRTIFSDRYPPKGIPFAIVAVTILLASSISNIGSYQFTGMDYDTDGKYYNAIANAMLSWQSETRGGEDIGRVIMPGYPGFVAIVYLLFGQSLLNAVVAQLVISTFALFVFYWLCRRYFNHLISLMATLWLAFYVELWHYSFYMLMETVTASFLIFSLFFLERLLRTNNRSDAIYFGLMFGSLIAINNRFIAHFCLLTLFLFLLHLARRKVRARVFVIPLMIVVAFLLPWHVRQYLHYDRVVFISPTESWHVTEIEGVRRPRRDIFDTYENYIKVLTTPISEMADHDKFIHRFTKEKYNQMTEEYDAFHGYKKYLSRFIGFWEIVRVDFRFGFGGDTRITPPNIYGTTQILRMLYNLVFLGFMFVFMFYGFVRGFIKRDYFIISLFVLLVAHVFLHTLLHYIPRYRLTIVPVVFFVGWYGLREIFARKAQQ